MPSSYHGRKLWVVLQCEQLTLRPGIMIVHSDCTLEVLLRQHCARSSARVCHNMLAYQVLAPTSLYFGTLGGWWWTLQFSVKVVPHMWHMWLYRRCQSWCSNLTIAFLCEGFRCARRWLHVGGGHVTLYTTLLNHNRISTWSEIRW